MRFQKLPLSGAYLIVPDRQEDERGYFARTYCRQTILEKGLEDCGLQCSLSHNRASGTLRGMHFQKHPHAETKLVRCSRGSAFDVIVDLRPSSPTFAQWYGTELSQENVRALYIPKDFAHGFVTLRDETDVVYQMAEPFVPSAASGFRWNDGKVGIDWPVKPTVVSERDSALPPLKDLRLR